MVLSVAGIPLLGGCTMMGGVAHKGGLGRMSEPGRVWNAQPPAPVQPAEASSEALTIALAVGSPISGAATAIDAWLLTDSIYHDLTDGDIWLRIETPSGSVDQLHVQRVDSSGKTTFQAEYRFAAGGVYLGTPRLGRDRVLKSVRSRLQPGRLLAATCSVADTVSIPTLLRES